MADIELNQEALEAAYKAFKTIVSNVQLGYDHALDFAIKSYLSALPKAGWQPIETAPSGVNVLLHYKNCLGKSRIIKAAYFQKHMEESGPEDDNCEYHEASDTYFTPAGWYEQIDNWDDFTSVALENRNTPTHWMHLPKPPEGE